MRCLAYIAISAVVGCGRRISKDAARLAADKAISSYARRKGLQVADFALKEYDDSGTVVDWSFAYESKASPKHLVSVLVDRHGGTEVHSLVENK